MTPEITQQSHSARPVYLGARSAPLPGTAKAKAIRHRGLSDADSTHGNGTTRLDTERTIPGRSQDHPGRTQNHFETIPGPSRDDPRTFPGRSQDHPGTIPGPVQDNPRTMTGRPQDISGTIPGSSGAIPGSSRDVSRTSLLLADRSKGFGHPMPAAAGYFHDFSPTK